MHKQSLVLSSLFLFCLGTFMNAQQQEAKLICLNNVSVNPHTVYLFAHGIDLRSNTCTKQAIGYIDSNIITGPCYTFDFGDGIRTINLGQDNDCALFVNAYKQVREKHPHAAIILIGLSRGAATILNSLALYPDVDWSPIKAAILESPYAQVKELAEQIAKSYLFFMPFKQSLMHKVINSLPSYKPEGIQTIDMVGKIKTHFPFFIGYAETDKTVPAEGTRMLIEKLRSAGQDVMVFSSKKGKHSMLGSNAAYTQAAREFLRGFKK